MPSHLNSNTHTRTRAVETITKKYFQQLFYLTNPNAPNLQRQTFWFDK